MYGTTDTSTGTGKGTGKTLPSVISKSVGDGVDSKRAKNIYITFDAMLKVLGNQIISDNKKGRDIIDNLNIGFTQLLNNANQLSE